ncbi:SIR2 family NAD-dependent protein deacylase [Sorangium sp. So ce426]|uniref:SIR2 family NAD-dependent protein deacylase n=1 Tax=Sorangium sp. So ce426 TaxID=3133312 RepID=UPI003F5C4ACA
MVVHLGSSGSGADPALEELRQAYRGGDLVAFAGAGVSVAAGLPSREELIERLAARCRARGAAVASLLEIATLAEQQRFIDALSAIKECLGPVEFGAAVARDLDDRAIERLPDIALAIGALRPLLRALLTTNLDGLLERAFAGAWPAVARATADLAQRRQYILKLHGTLVDRSTWVLTRQDYDHAMNADENLKQVFRALFNTCTLLFVGYRLSDDDFDAVLARVRAFAGDQPPRHFALVPSDAATPYRRRQLEKAGVRLVLYDNVDGQHREVVRILRELAGGEGAGADRAEPPFREAEAAGAEDTPVERLRQCFLLGFRLSLAARIKASNLASPERADDFVGRQLKRANQNGRRLGFTQPIALESPKPGEDKSAYLKRCFKDAALLHGELGRRHGVGPKTAFILAFDVGMTPEFVEHLDEPSRLDVIARYQQQLRTLGISDASLRSLEQDLKAGDSARATDAVFEFKRQVTDALHERLSGSAPKARELDVWLYASNAAAIAAAYSTGKLGPADMPDLVRTSNDAAERLGLTVPELPPRKGEKISDTADVWFYLLSTLCRENADEVRERFGPDALAILVLAAKLHMLLIVYAPEDDISTALVAALTRACRALEVPDDVWMPLVRRIERKEDYEMIKSQIFAFKRRFEQHLEWRVEEAKQRAARHG